MSTISLSSNHVSSYSRHNKSHSIPLRLPKGRKPTEPVSPTVGTTVPQEWNQHAQKLFLFGKPSGMLAHDLNNILSTIVKFIELAILTQLDHSAAHRRLQHALLSTKRGTTLIHQFLKCAGENHKTTSPQSMKLRVLISEALTLIQSNIPPSFTNTHVDHCQSGTILGHSLQILRLIHNLLSNAIHAMTSQKNELLHTRPTENTLPSRSNEFRR